MGVAAAIMQASLMFSFFSVWSADLVKSRSMTGITPLAETMAEKSTLNARHTVEAFKVSFSLFFINIGDGVWSGAPPDSMSLEDGWPLNE
ncbi:hypothetical protein [Pseudomonas sp. S2_F03]